MSKDVKGVNLGFGTDEVGKASVVLYYANSWLNLKFYITADKGTITMLAKDIEYQGELLGVASNDDIKELNDLDFYTMNGFNAGIVGILKELIDNEEEMELDGFELVGIRLDLD